MGVKVVGGDEGSRTPVRKQIHTCFSECSLCLRFPSAVVHKQTSAVGSFICHDGLKALPVHVHH